MLTYPLHRFLNDKNIFHINFTRSLTFQWKLLSYGKAWRAFRKQNFGLCSTTYYSTVPITCTQTRIHRTQSLHYNKLLKHSSIRHIVTMNFPATIYHGDISFCFARYRCNEVSLERYLSEISRRLYRYLDVVSF